MAMDLDKLFQDMRDLAAEFDAAVKESGAREGWHLSVSINGDNGKYSSISGPPGVRYSFGLGYSSGDRIDSVAHPGDLLEEFKRRRIFVKENDRKAAVAEGSAERDSA